MTAPIPGSRSPARPSRVSTASSRRTRWRSSPTSSADSGRRAASTSLPPRGAPGRTRRRRAPGLPPGDGATSGPRTGRWRRAGRPRRPAGRDHRPGRAEDDDQRAQLGRAGVHGRPRGRALADLGERRRRPGGDRDAVRRTLDASTSPEGKAYRLNERDGDARRPAARLAPGRDATCWSTARRCRRSLFDAGLYLFHNAAEALAPRVRPVLLPAQAGEPSRGAAVERRLRPRPGGVGVPRGSVRATVLIETILAAFEMDEILYELREHAAGLNAGRWDYIFTLIKRFRDDPALVLPGPRAGDDGRAVHARLHASCWSRPATGAARTRSAAWPRSSRTGASPRSRRTRWPRSARTRTANRATASTARGSRTRTSCRSRRRCSTACSATGPNQKDRLREEVRVAGSRRCSTCASPGGAVTEAGVRANVSVALRVPRRLAARQRRGGDRQPDGGRGDGRDQPLAALAVAAPWDAARRRRAVRRRAATADPRRGAGADRRRAPAALAEAAGLLDGLVLDDDFPEFLTLEAYPLLDSTGSAAAAPGAAPRTARSPGRPTNAPSRTTNTPRTIVDPRRRAPPALVGRVVAGVVEVGRADRAPGSGIEQHEVRVAPDLDRALHGHPEQARRRRRQDVDESLRGDPSGRDPALAVGHRRAASRSRVRRSRSGRTTRASDCFSTRRGPARGRWRRARASRRPARPTARRDCPAARSGGEITYRAASSGGSVVAIVGQRQVVRAGLGEHRLPGGARRAHLRERLGRGEVDDVQRRLRGPARARSPARSPRPRRTAAARSRGTAARSRRRRGGAP